MEAIVATKKQMLDALLCVKIIEQNYDAIASLLQIEFETPLEKFLFHKIETEPKNFDFVTESFQFVKDFMLTGYQGGFIAATQNDLPADKEILTFVGKKIAESVAKKTLTHEKLTPFNIKFIKANITMLTELGGISYGLGANRAQNLADKVTQMTTQLEDDVDKPDERVLH